MDKTNGDSGRRAPVGPRGGGRPALSPVELAAIERLGELEEHCARVLALVEERAADAGCEAARRWAQLARSWLETGLFLALGSVVRPGLGPPLSASALPPRTDLRSAGDPVLAAGVTARRVAAWLDAEGLEGMGTLAELGVIGPPRTGWSLPSGSPKG